MVMITKARLVYCSLVAAVMVVAGCAKTEDSKQESGARSQNSEDGGQAVATANSSEATRPAALPPGHPDIGMSAQALPPGAAAEAPNPQWTVPSGWQEGKPAPMRRATFVVKDAQDQTAEIVVSAFPGDVGGLLANVNRWRGQIGLGPVATRELASMVSDLEINGTKTTVVDFKTDTAPTGKTQPQRMIVVTLPHAGNSWFFKMTGDGPLVEAQKETLLEFVKSVKF